MISNNIYSLLGLCLLLCLSCNLQTVPDDMEGAPTASFSVGNDNCEAPCSVSFTSNTQGNASSFAWDFGDPTSGADNSSTLENPSHTYQTAGSYTVMLIASNSSGADTASQVVTISGGSGPSAQFTANQDVDCPSLPCETSFSNQSTNASSYLWDFGDGNTSTDETPTHEYLNHGTYKVLLTVSEGGESDTVSQLVEIKPTTFQVEVPGVLGRPVDVFNVTGGYVLIARTTSNTFRYIKLNEAGTVNTNVALNFEPAEVQIKAGSVADDGSIGLIGSQGSSFDRRPFFAGLSAGGVIADEVIYGNAFFTEASEGSSIVALPGGGFAFTGHVGNSNRNAILAKVNSNGVMQAGFPNQYGGTLDDLGFDIKLTAAGGFVMVGHGETNSQNGSWFTVTNANGTELLGFPKIYDDPIGSSAVEVIETSDGGFAFTGSNVNNFDFFLVRTNSNGNDVFTPKTYQLENNANLELPSSLGQLADEGFAIFGETYVNAEAQYDATLVRVDKDGNAWPGFPKRLTNSAAGELAVKGIISPDGGMLIVLGRDDDDKIFALKLDSNGDF